VTTRGFLVSATSVVGAGTVATLVGRHIARRRRAARQTVGTEQHAASVGEVIHATKVSRIAAQLCAHDASRPVSLRKKAPPHQVPKGRDLRRRDDKIDVSDLTQILHVDPIAQLCIAESGVMFCDLVEATLRFGLVPIVVPELKTITIGGAVSGCSIESMSYRYGGFHDTCVEYEVVTGRGEVLTCRPDNEHSLVFQMLHGSFGTLGILTKLTFKLVPAKSFVRVDYERYDSLIDYQDAINRYSRAAHDIDFMDGIIHRPDELVLSLGRFVDDAPYTHSYDWTRVYYKSTATRSHDYLRTQDYFFRYDRGVTNVHPRSFVGRLLLGKLLDSGRSLWLANKLSFLFRSERPTVTLDVFLPFSKISAFMEWYEHEVGFFPLWCVPYKRVRDYEWLDESFYAGTDDELFVDLAIYGMKQPPGKNIHRMLEEKLRELGGVKTLISHNYYSEREFWSIWNRRNYDEVKAITDPENVFRDLYTKTCRTAMGLAG
jgi:FAD/FMN-containing dehydrogenase